MSSTLARILTYQTPCQMAGFRAFRDGHRYFERGQAYGLTQDRDTITARLPGMYEYTVRLWVDENGAGHACSCPAGEGFCKHCVAVGLT